MNPKSSRALLTVVALFTMTFNLGKLKFAMVLDILIPDQSTGSTFPQYVSLLAC